QAAAKAPTRDNVEAHVGYYLLEQEGWGKLAQACDGKGRGLRQFRRIARLRPNLVYFPALAFIFLLFLTV
ncbi:MAG TPA: hypothetical protein DD734_07430, partial [Firmicutes bacterium]|nr:hypothetical protein [Bacillota bacterium]